MGGTDEWNDILNGSNTKTFLTQSYSNFISRGKAGGKILKNFSTVYRIGIFFMSWLVLGDKPLLNSYLS